MPMIYTAFLNVKNFFEFHFNLKMLKFISVSPLIQCAQGKVHQFLDIQFKTENRF